ncbi:hypothetical protein TI05_18205, partial [Achromatium sp. WMS3]
QAVWGTKPVLCKISGSLLRLSCHTITKAARIPAIEKANKILLAGSTPFHNKYNAINPCKNIKTIAAYILIPSATTVLSAEGPALWLLTSAPISVFKILQRKLMLWTGLAFFYTAIAFSIVLWLVPWPGSYGFADAIMVILGIPLFAVIATGLGAASADPNEPNPQLRQNSDANTALMLFMMMHIQAIFNADAHVRLVWLMLSAVFAYSLWQRLEERFPWILDPTDSPPERIDLTHGAVAAMVFMFLQGFIALYLLWNGVEPANRILLAFSIAGILAALVIVWQLRRNKLPDILHNTGLVPQTA